MSSGDPPAPSRLAAVGVGYYLTNSRGCRDFIVEQVLCRGQDRVRMFYESEPALIDHLD